MRVWQEVLVIAGRLARRRHLPEHAPLATTWTRRLVGAMDRYTDRHGDLPPQQLRRVLESEGFLRGLEQADHGDTAGAMAGWAGAIIARLGQRPALRYLPPPSDETVAKSYELLAREYVRFADWATAGEAFLAASFFWRPVAEKRRSLCSALVCALRGGDAEAVDDLLDLMRDPTTHEPSRILARLARGAQDNRLSTRDCDDRTLDGVLPLGETVYGYLASAVVGSLARAGHRERALALAGTAISRLAERHAAEWIIGDLQQQAALVCSSGGDHAGALRFALAAWGRLDAQRYRSCGHEQRQSLWRHAAPARAVALRSALALEDVAAVAELIESCRLQSLLATEIEVETDTPTGLDQSGVTADSGDNDAVAQTRPGDGGSAPEARSGDGDGAMASTAMFTALHHAMNSTRLEPPSFVSYAGRSRLADAYPVREAVQRAEVVSLQDILPEGIFWSSHIEDGSMFWFAARAGSPLGCGVTDLRDEPRLGSILVALAGYSDASEPEGWALPDAARESGVYYEPLLDLASWRSPEEQIVTRTLGGLLPHPVVAALSGADRDGPVRLTIAAARELTCVPWAIVMLPGSDSRLIERASLRLWTSAATEAVRAGRAPADGVRADPARAESGGAVPFLVACDNPDGSLRTRQEGSLVEKASVRFGIGSGYRLATKDALLEAFHATGVQARGLFFYRGHALHDSDPAYSALPLSETEGVAAGELLGRFDDGTPFLPMPERVVVSCCSSSSGALLGGEGVGLVAGLIRSGADQVIATSIDILDASFTLAFDELLVEQMLDPAADHADRLRELQLRMLREWMVFSVRGTSDYTDDVRDPHPIIWAFYHAF